MRSSNCVTSLAVAATLVAACLPEAGTAGFNENAYWECVDSMPRNMPDNEKAKICTSFEGNFNRAPFFACVHTMPVRMPDEEKATTCLPAASSDGFSREPFMRCVRAMPRSMHPSEMAKTCLSKG